MANEERRTYLGDGVHVASDGYGFWLTLTVSEDHGIRVTDRIYIEPPVWRSLQAWVKALGGDGDHDSSTRAPNALTKEIK